MTICNPWRVAASLNQLLNQLNARAPGRSKASDGAIGDAAHQSEACSSQHNSCCVRYLGIWIVRARDFTHDPAGGADMGEWTEAWRRSRDPRVRYIIFNRRITGPSHTDAFGNWVWVHYDGDSPHEEHAHVSVTDSQAQYDNTARWAEPGLHALGTPDEEDDTMGASFGPITIEAATTSLCIPPVAAGAADPRDAWLRIGNDTGGKPGQTVAPPYALRIVTSDGTGWKPITPAGPLVKLDSGVPVSWQLPPKATIISIIRAAIGPDGKVLDPTQVQPDGAPVPYAGPLTCCIERGPVVKAV
jgi:hypothetical protein